VLPLGRERAEAFWAGVLDGASRGERIVLVAEERDTGAVVGTAQVILAMPENQPHRGEVAKMLVRRRARRRGVGEALLLASEEAMWTPSVSSATVTTETASSSGSRSAASARPCSDAMKTDVSSTPLTARPPCRGGRRRAAVGARHRPAPGWPAPAPWRPRSS